LWGAAGLGKGPQLKKDVFRGGGFVSWIVRKSRAGWGRNKEGRRMPIGLLKRKTWVPYGLGTIEHACPRMGNWWGRVEGMAPRTKS